MNSKAYYHVLFVMDDGEENGIGGSCNYAEAVEIADEVEREHGERPLIREEKIYFTARNGRMILGRC